MSKSFNIWFLPCLVMMFLVAPTLSPAVEPQIDFEKQVFPLLQKYCTGCHNNEDRDADLSLESVAEMLKGGESGPAIIPGNGTQSLLVRVLNGDSEIVMPPEDQEAPSQAEVALLISWIESGAKGPKGKEVRPTTLSVPVIKTHGDHASPVTSLAWSPDGKLIALARFKQVDLLNSNDLTIVRQLKEFPGKVNSVQFSQDGRTLLTASGIVGLYGKATLWNVADGKEIRSFQGHRDTIYSAVLSPDGKYLATGSYDRDIILWDAESGEFLRNFPGHNDAIYDLAFSPDGKLLSSASGDTTAKIWQVETGKRLDTLGQPLKELYTTSFSPDGKFVYAAGVDNRIRAWRVISRESPKINPLVYARFAHLGPIVNMGITPNGQFLVTTSEDKTIKLWETRTLTQLSVYEKQTQIADALALSPRNDAFVVGRTDGSIQVYPINPTRETTSKTVTKTSSNQSSTKEETFHIYESQEPNDLPEVANRIELPAQITGTIQVVEPGVSEDADLFRFQAAAGEQWILEVKAARDKSLLDSKIEVLNSAGEPVLRKRLRAVRDSYFTFRGKDSSTTGDFRVFNWEEMELNEYLYANGEVVKLWLYPRGPDSGFKVYPATGKRFGYFDTTPLAHALQEPCYIVEPYEPHEEIIPNGLPVFNLYYENDDESQRRLGTDSQLTFTAPEKGEYLARVTDVRGFQSEKHVYQLEIRRPQPDFKVTLAGKDPTLKKGTGREFRLNIVRTDGFEGPVEVNITDIPPGFTVSSPITIEAGHSFAFGTLNALPEAPALTEETAKSSKITAKAIINGKEVVHDIGSLGEIKLSEEAPKILLQVISSDNDTEQTDPQKPLELTVAPGETISARVRIVRNGFEERVPLGKEDAGRNLPHGVIVDNIGLNGLMIVEGQTEQTFFLTAAKWMPDTTRLFHLKASVDDGLTTLPVILHVKSDNLPQNNQNQ